MFEALLETRRLQRASFVVTDESGKDLLAEEHTTVQESGDPKVPASVVRRVYALVDGTPIEPTVFNLVFVSPATGSQYTRRSVVRPALVDSR